MGAPKGKPHRKFTQAEKLAYIAEFQDAHISQSKFAKEHGLNSVSYTHLTLPTILLV